MTTTTKPITDAELAELDKQRSYCQLPFEIDGEEYDAIRERLRLAEAIVDAAKRLEDAFDIRDTPKQASAERKLARALTAYRQACGPSDRGTSGRET